MSIKQNGGVFGRNPTFNDVTIEGELTFNGDIDITSDLTIEGTMTANDVNITDTTPNLKFTDTDGNHLANLTQSGSHFYIDNDSTGDIRFRVDGNTERLTVNSTGIDVTGTATMDSLGIGTVPSEPLHVKEGSSGITPKAGTVALIEGSGNTKVTVASGATSTGELLFGRSTDNDAGRIIYDHNDNSLSFYTSNSEAMRLSGGNLLVGKTSASYSTVGQEFRANGVTILGRDGGEPLNLNRLNSDGGILNFRKDNTTVGSVSVTGSATAYNTSSDYRLKEDVQPLSGATARLKELKPVNFAWKADGSRVDGFLAHEAQEVVPESVTGSKDAMQTEEYEVSPATGDIYTPEVIAVEGVEAVDYVAPQDEVLDEDGNVVTESVAEVMAVEAVEAVEGVAEVIHSADAEKPSELEDGQLWRETTAQVMGEREVPDYQGIDQAKLVPLLVATIQELEARITALES